MSSIDLRMLRYFIAVAEEGHLTRAAVRIGIQQPPLSQQIRQLEAELGATLFRRLPRGMALTEAGQALLVEARALFAQFESTLDSVRGVARGEMGHLAIGFTESASLHPFVPRVLRAFREAAPEVALHAGEDNTPALVRALHDKRLDGAFIRSPVAQTQGLVIEPILTEEMVAAFPSGHPLSRRGSRSIRLEALAGEPMLLLHRTDGPGFYDLIIAACQSAGFSPQVVQETEKNLPTLTLVAAGLGVAIMPASMQYVGLEGVSYRKITGAPGLRAPLHLAWREDADSAALLRLIGIARGIQTQQRAG